MCSIYSVDVKVYATAYITAGSAAEALEIAKMLKANTLMLDPSGCMNEIDVSECMLDGPNLPDVSLSPAMIVHGPDDDAIVKRVD